MIKFKFAFTVLLVFLLALCLSPVVFARINSQQIEVDSLNEVAVADLDAIKDIISRYFDARYYMQSNLTTEINLDKFFVPNDIAKEFIEKEKKYLELYIEHCKMQNNDLRFKDYSYKLDFVNGNANVIVFGN